MIEALEARCRESGGDEIKIHVVNLREELPPFYRRFGCYEDTGTLPFPDDGSSSKLLGAAVRRGAAFRPPEGSHNGASVDLE